MNDSLVHTLDFSHTAPALPSPLIRRPHLLRTIAQIFSSNIDVVSIEAPAGYGKTSLLLEFSDSIQEPCFGAFIRTSSRFSYDPSLIRFDLANQAYRFLTASTLQDNEEPTDGDLRNLWGRCSRALMRQRKSGYIILDGVQEIPSNEASIRSAIINILPFGVKPFRFLFTGQLDKILGPDANKFRAKPFTLSAFTSHETDEYLADVVEEKQKRTEYHHACSGVPSLLASLRRQIVSFAETKPSIDLSSDIDLDAMYEVEWKGVENLSQEIQSVSRTYYCLHTIG